MTTIEFKKTGLNNFYTEAFFVFKEKFKEPFPNKVLRIGNIDDGWCVRYNHLDQDDFTLSIQLEAGWMHIYWEGFLRAAVFVDGGFFTDNETFEGADNFMKWVYEQKKHFRRI